MICSSVCRAFCICELLLSWLSYRGSSSFIGLRFRGGGSRLPAQIPFGMKFSLISAATNIPGSVKTESRKTCLDTGDFLIAGERLQADRQAERAGTVSLPFRIAHSPDETSARLDFFLYAWLAPLSFS
jgi:hypothetical protein